MSYLAVGTGMVPRNDIKKQVIIMEIPVEKGGGEGVPGLGVQQGVAADSQDGRVHSGRCGGRREVDSG